MKTVENFGDFSFDPNSVLARSETPISPQEPPPSIPALSRPDRIPPDKPSHADAQPYVTRSGRQVKPAQRYTADEWIVQRK